MRRTCHSHTHQGRWARSRYTRGRCYGTHAHRVLTCVHAWFLQYGWLPSIGTGVLQLLSPDVYLRHHQSHNRKSANQQKMDPSFWRRFRPTAAHSQALRHEGPWWWVALRMNVRACVGFPLPLLVILLFGFLGFHRAAFPAIVGHDFVVLFVIVSRLVDSVPTLHSTQ